MAVRKAVFKANLVRITLMKIGIQSHKQQSNFLSKISPLQWENRSGSRNNVYCQFSGKY